MPRLNTINRILIPVLILIALLFVAFPALADYLGPDRTRTESYWSVTRKSVQLHCPKYPHMWVKKAF
jgi:hypothetical protein